MNRSRTATGSGVGRSVRSRPLAQGAGAPHRPPFGAVESRAGGDRSDDKAPGSPRPEYSPSVLALQVSGISWWTGNWSALVLPSQRTRPCAVVKSSESYRVWLHW